MATETTTPNGSRSDSSNGRGNSGRRADGAAKKPAAARKRAPASRASAEPLIELEIVEQEQPVELPRTRGARVAGALKEAGSAVGEAVAGHAVPAALIGAGLAWLLLESSPAKRRMYAAARRIEESELLGRARETFDEVSERVSGRAESVKESVKDTFTDGATRGREMLSGAAEAAREGASRLGESAQEGVRAVGSRLREGASAVGEGARRGYDLSREGATRAWQEHPMATGLAAMAAGVALGRLLPRTRRENDTLGPQSDAVSQRLRTAGRELVERGRQVVSSATDALKEEAEGEGLGPQEVARKVRRIAGHVQEATATAARRVRLDPVSVLADVQADAPETASTDAAGERNGSTRPRRKK